MRIRAIRAIAIALAALHCGRDAAPPERAPSPATAAALLEDLASRGHRARVRTIERWVIDPLRWHRIVVDPFKDLYAEYHRELVPMLPVLERLRATQRFASRPHFAGDPELTPGQARARWLLPTLFPSEVATVDGAPLDVVFVRDGDEWFVLTGIDRILRARIDRHDRACGVTFDAPRPSKTCRDTAWAVADATLRNDVARISRACTLLATACGKPSP